MHINKQNGKRYIGITKQKVNRRWSVSRYKQCKAFYNAVLKYGWDNFEHIILEDNLSKLEAYQKEIEYISKYNTTNRKYGYNITFGGDMGISDENIISERNRKIRKSTSCPIYKERRRVMSLGDSNGFYGRSHSNDSKLKMRNKKLGKKQTLDHIQKVAKAVSKPVVMLDPNGHFIEGFSSSTEATKKLNKKHLHITECCQGKRKTAGGYKWMYLEEYESMKALE